MKRIISLFICMVFCFLVVGCKSGDLDKSHDSIVSETEEVEEKIVQYTSKYEPGCSRWLNLCFNTFGDHGYDTWWSHSDRNDEAYIRAKRYFGGPSDLSVEFEAISPGLTSRYIGIYTQDSHDLKIDELIEENKERSEKLLKNDSEKYNLVWEWKEEEEFVLYDTKYRLVTLQSKIIDKYGRAPLYDNYTYWDLYRVKDNKLITIHCSGISSENNLNDMLSPLEPIGPDRKTITFGSFEQDGNATNGKEKIEWYILNEDVENKKALIISKHALAYQGFTNREFMNSCSYEDNCAAYELSSLRAWLNTKFVDDAFTTDERKRILLTNVSAEKNPKYDTEPGKSTEDLVFVLSISEFETFFNSYNDRAYRSKTTVVEKAIEEKPNNRCNSIWLRNPGEYPDFYSTCVMNGSISSKTSLESGLVYPVMWINME